MNPGALPDGSVRHQDWKTERACGLQPYRPQRKNPPRGRKDEKGRGRCVFPKRCPRPLQKGRSRLGTGKDTWGTCVGYLSLLTPVNLPLVEGKPALFPQSNSTPPLLGISVRQGRAPEVLCSSEEDKYPNLRGRIDSENKITQDDDENLAPGARLHLLGDCRCVRARANLILPQPWVMKLVSNTCTFQVSNYFDRIRLKAEFIVSGNTRNHKYRIRNGSIESLYLNSVQ